MANKAEARVFITGDAKGFHVAMRRATWSAMTFQAKMVAIGGQMKRFGRTMTYGVTMPIVGGLALATKAAIDEGKEMALLDKALRNNVKATDEQVAAVERWVTATQNATGVADGELRPALATLLTATKDTAEAQDLLGVALDIAAAKGKPIEAVATAMMKAYNGNTGALGRLGIKTKDATGKTMDFDEAMKNASATFGGSAAKAAETTSGKLAILKAQLADMAENIGTILIPFVEKAAGIIKTLADRFSKLSPTTKKVVVVVGLLLAALGPLMMILGSIMTAMPILAAAFGILLGPVGMVIAVIAALVVLFVTLYKKNETFRRGCDRIWKAIKIVVTGAVKVIIAIIRDWWADMKTAWRVAETVGKKVAAAFGWIRDAASKAWDWLTKVADRLTFGYSTKLLDKLRDAINWLLGPLQKVWGFLQKILGSQDKVRTNYTGPMYKGHETTGPVSAHAAGGVFTRPTFGLFGERGAEAIIPLTNPKRAAQVMAQAGLLGAGGSTTINVNVVVPGGTTIVGTARQVGDILAPHIARALTASSKRAARRR